MRIAWRAARARRIGGLLGMHHFLFVGDKREVLGVWVVEDEVSATRLQLRLGLMYPDCRTVVDEAQDFETLKAGHADYEFGAIEPDLSPVV
jgi:hypothetical protein